MLLTFLTFHSFQARTEGNYSCDQMKTGLEQFNFSSVFQQSRIQVVHVEEGRLSTHGQAIQILNTILIINTIVLNSVKYC